MNKGNWFWHSRLMNWVESALLDLTNWVWRKRHVTTNYTKPKGPATTPADPTKAAPAKKVPAKKAPAKKKSDWNVK